MLNGFSGEELDHMKRYNSRILHNINIYLRETER